MSKSLYYDPERRTSYFRENSDRQSDIMLDDLFFKEDLKHLMKEKAASVRSKDSFPKDAKFHLGVVYEHVSGEMGFSLVSILDEENMFINSQRFESNGHIKGFSENDRSVMELINFVFDRRYVEEADLLSIVVFPAFEERFERQGIQSDLRDRVLFMEEPESSPDLFLEGGFFYQTSKS